MDRELNNPKGGLFVLPFRGGSFKRIRKTKLNKNNRVLQTSVLGPLIMSYTNNSLECNILFIFIII